MTKRTTITIEEPTLQDGKKVAQLLSQIPELDRNSEYLYLLLCTHFSDTCQVARDGDKVVGVVTAYSHPQNPEVLFVWQIGVHPHYAKQGIGWRLITQLIDRLLQKVTVIQATISPSNTPSRKLFQKVADYYESECQWSTFFETQHFTNAHEDEELLTIKLSQNVLTQTNKEEKNDNI